MKKTLPTAPVMRFYGFADLWEQRTLGDLAEVNPRSVIPEKFEYVDLESVVGTEIIAHRTETRESAPSRAQRLAKKGDVFYQTVRPYQKNNCLFDGGEGSYVFSTGYAQLRSHGDSYFLLTMLQREEFVNNVLDRCTGTSYPAINANVLAGLIVSCPVDIQEQKKIGQYFKSLDNLIALHQRKLNQQKKLKKYFLQNMFQAKGEKVPRIRFKGFTGDWEQRKLGDISSLITKGTTPKDKSGTGDVNFIKVENINDFSGNITGMSKISLEEHQGYLKRSQLQEGDILFSIAGTLGRVTSVNKAILPANTNQALSIIRLKEGNLEYVKTCLKGNVVADFIRKNPTIGAQPNLSLEQVSNLKIEIPSETEQKIIGEYFSNLDNLITLHQRKLNQLLTMKKYMLQNMFV